MGNKKHPVLKVVLIIVGVIIVISVIANIAGGSDSGSNSRASVAADTNTEAGEEKSSVQFIKAGMYKVGSELPAGEYIIEATGNMAYYQISSDSFGEFDSIIVNDNFYKGAFVYVILQDGDYIKIDSGKMIDASQLIIQA
jgi:hypothetical protein